MPFLNTVRYFSQKQERAFVMIYVALILLSFHWALIIYINSAFLAQYISPAEISILYIIGSIASLACFFYMPYFMQRIGNYSLTVLLALLEVAAVIGMAVSTSALLASAFFLLHFVAVPLLFLNLDIFIEASIGTREKHTGTLRGLYLSLLSLAAALGPLTTGGLVAANDVSFVLTYLVSAVFLLPFLAIIFIYFRTFIDPAYTLLSLSSMIKAFKESPDTRNIVIINAHLQLFFTWMVIYTPLYLAHTAGFSWQEIGSIMFVGLSAYVIFEYPIGIIADKYIGEKEMMALGFVVIAVSTSWFAFLLDAPIGMWMTAMFLTRVGASLVEATSESYFFKHANGTDTHTISLFRMARPFSSVVGATLGSIAFLFLPFNLIFILLAILMIPGLFFTLLLKDTK